MPTTTFNAILAHLSHFLTVAIHTILAERNCYPPQSFITVRAYNLPVRQSRVPDVCSWIQEVIAAVRIELTKGIVAHVVLAISQPDTSEVLERYVFDLQKMPKVPLKEVDTPIIWERGDGASSGEKEKEEAALDPRGPGGAREHELVDLTEQLRGTLASISVCRRRLRPIPEGCPFTVAIELKDDADPPIGHPQPWIPVQPGLQRMKGGNADDESSSNSSQEAFLNSPEAGSRSKMGSELGGSKTIPMRTVDAEGFAFELWVEEGQAKAQSQQQSQ